MYCQLGVIKLASYFSNSARIRLYLYQGQVPYCMLSPFHINTTRRIQPLAVISLALTLKVLMITSDSDIKE